MHVGNYLIINIRTLFEHILYIGIFYGDMPPKYNLWKKIINDNFKTLAIKLAEEYVIFLPQDFLG